MKAGLTPKQAKFVEEYLIDLNATAAARRAGYSGRNADKIGPALLGESRVLAAIQAGRQRGEERTQVTADRTLTECALIAFSDIGEILDFTQDQPRIRPAHEIPPHARRAISSIKVKRYVEGQGEDARTVEVTEFKFWSKDAALERLFKHFGLLGADEKPADLQALLALLARNGKPNGKSSDVPRIYDA